MKIFFTVIFAIFLGGCSGDIKSVKESRISGRTDFTIGQAFDNRHFCSSIDWKTFKDDRQRPIVEYTCEYKLAKDYYKMHVDANIAENDFQLDAAIKRNDKFLNDLKENLTVSKKSLEYSKVELKEYIEKVKIDPPSGYDRKRDYDNRIINMEERIKASEDEIKEKELKVNKVESTRAPETAELKMKADNSNKSEKLALENFLSAGEKIQWIVINNDPKLISTNLEIRSKNSKKEIPFVQYNVLDGIYSNSEKMSNLHALMLNQLWANK